MQIDRQFTPFPQPTAVALGYFDGVHAGHRSVIAAAVRYAEEKGLVPSVFTFTLDSAFLASRGGDILSVGLKEKRIAQMGVQYCLMPPASAFYGKSGPWFVQEVLQKTMGAKAVFCGRDFTFGKEREANVDMLRRLCQPLGIEVFVLEDVEVEGEKVSSTRIRKALEAGEMELAQKLLGAPYAIDFPVAHGRQVGRRLGFPTINQIYPEGLLQPKFGVYLTAVCIDGETYAGATGFGSHPTVEQAVISSETYIEGYSGDLYGKNIEVAFLQFFTPEKKFSSLDGVKQLIADTARAARQYLQSHPAAPCGGQNT